MAKSLKKFLLEQRSSARLAYVLHLGTKLVTSALGLVWIRLLVAAMGQELNSLYLAFQKLVTLGGLGDLGMGGAVGIRVGQYIGEGRDAELKKFLASARAVFLILAVTVACGMLALSPVLPRWLGYKEVPAAGTTDFSTNDFLHLESLAAKLKQPSDPVSIYVNAHLLFVTPDLLAAPSDTNADLRIALTDDFNQIAHNRDFYEAQRFAGIKLSARATEILKQTSATNKPDELNRLLLMDAYPQELDRPHPSGPLRPLFAIGALLIFGVLLSSYLSNLNYACGNVTWPVIPLFVVLQLTLLGQVLLARHEQPLWIQYLPVVMCAFVGMWLTWFYVRVSHRSLSNLWPLAFDWQTMVSLFENSFWIYLCTLGNLIYRSTDSQVINKGFKLGTLSGYEYNYKFCELVVFLVLTASFVSLPKITQWMSSPKPEDRERVRVEMRRLNQFQTLLGCGAALAYLAGNNLFMKVWFLHAAHPVLPAALPLQLAFALNLAVTTSGDAGIQLSLRTGKSGLRRAGIAIGLTGLLNLALSIVAMKMGSLLGIALATVLAQSVLSLVASFFTCRYLEIPWGAWAMRGWLFPLVGVACAGWLRMKLPLDSAQNVLLLVGAYAALLVVAAWGLGVNVKMLREELKIVGKVLRK